MPWFTGDGCGLDTQAWGFSPGLFPCHALLPGLRLFLLPLTSIWGNWSLKAQEPSLLGSLLRHPQAGYDRSRSLPRAPGEQPPSLFIRCPQVPSTVRKWAMRPASLIPPAHQGGDGHEETEVQCVSPKLMSRKEQANTGVPSLCLGSPCSFCFHITDLPLLRFSCCTAPVGSHAHVRMGFQARPSVGTLLFITERLILS